jgi:hypothetical protein
MIDAADGLGIAPAGAAIGGNFKHGPAGLGPAAQPPGSPAAAEADTQARICTKNSDSYMW